MSDMTQCNYCSFRSIKSRHRDEKITRKQSDKELGGIDVFVDGKFVAWFMELTDHCVC